MESIGVVAFCHGFKISDHCFLCRESGLCTLNGRHHTLLSYSPDHDLNAWSDQIQTTVAEQTKTIHGLIHYKQAQQFSACHNE